MPLKMKAERNAAVLLVAVSLAGCKLVTPLDEVSSNHAGSPNSNPGGGGGNGAGGGATNGGNNAGDAGSNNGGNVSASCDVCNISAFDCTVDANVGQATIVEVTSNGCTGTIGDGNGTSPIWINCDDGQACVDQESTCYGATFEDDAFSYEVTGGGTVSCVEATNTMPNCDEIELLVDGGFDDSSGAWVEASSNGFPLIQDESTLGSVAPHSGSYAAWLGGAPLEDSGLGQTVFIPEGTVSLTASGFFGVTSTDPGLADYAYASVGSDESGLALTFQMWDPRNAVTPWIPFSSTSDAADYAGLTLTYVIGSTTDDAENTNFFFDSLSLTATVCP